MYKKGGREVDKTEGVKRDTQAIASYSENQCKEKRQRRVQTIKNDEWVS